MGKQMMYDDSTIQIIIDRVTQLGEQHAELLNELVRTSEIRDEKDQAQHDLNESIVEAINQLLDVVRHLGTRVAALDGGEEPPPATPHLRLVE